MRIFISNFLDLQQKQKREMKRLPYIGILLTIFMSVSCGEDRSGEFYALIEDRIWIEETMRNNYLWYEWRRTLPWIMVSLKITRNI